MAASQDPTQIQINHPLHFSAPDGSDVQVDQGAYRIEQAAESQLRLASEGKPSVSIQAEKVSHETGVTDPIAMAVIEEGQEDHIHLVLVLPGGQALDAMGSFSGARARAVSPALLHPAQLRIAVNQITSQSQQSPPSSPSTIIRVPQSNVIATLKLPQSAVPPPPLSKTVSKSPTLVSWDYLRMHDPDFVLDNIKNVRDGKQDPKTLSGLASSARLSQLLKQNYSLTQTGQPSSVATTNRWAEIMNPGLSAQLAPSGGTATLKNGPARVSMQTKSIIAKIIPPPDYSPSQLNLGSTYSDHPITGKIQVIAPIDSSVTAMFPNDGKPFRVIKARALTGRMVPMQYVLPSGQTTQAVVTRWEEAASTMTPPFTLAVQSGQKIEYQVAFAPHMELFGGGNEVGKYASAFQVTGDWGWSASVPVIADFRGIAIGVIGTIDDNDITVIDEGVTCGIGVTPASMTFINADQQPRVVAVRGETPPNLQVQAFTVSLAAGERKQLAIPLTRNVCNEPEGVEQMGTIKYSYAGVERQAEFSVTVLPGFLHWYDYGTMGLCDYDWDIYANADGSTDLRWGFLNRNLYWMMMRFDFSLLGHPLGSGTLQENPSESAEKKAHLPLGPGGFVKENWKTIVNSSAPAQVSYTCRCWNC